MVKRTTIPLKRYTLQAPVIQTLDSTIHQAPVVQKMDSAIQQINIRDTNCTIHWITTQWISIRDTNCVIQRIEIYPVDSVIHLLNNWVQKSKFGETKIAK